VADQACPYLPPRDVYELLHGLVLGLVHWAGS
jgi:hypothetical protein